MRESVLRIAGWIAAAPLLLFGLFLLVRGGVGDGTVGPLVVGGLSVAIAFVILASTVEPRRWPEARVAGLVVLAALPLYHDLVGAPGLVVNVVLAGLAVFAAMRLPPARG